MLPIEWSSQFSSMINPFLKGCERGLSIKLLYKMSLRLTGYKYWFSNLRSWQHSIVLAWFGMPRGYSKNILACKFLLSEWNDERSAWQKLWKHLINFHENPFLIRFSFFVFTFTVSVNSIQFFVYFFLWEYTSSWGGWEGSYPRELHNN